MIIGICATVDFAFKMMLGSPEHTAITIHFLNAVLCGASPITRVTILNPIHEKETEDDKFIVLDILAEDQAGRLFNIEMQASLPAGMSQRLTYYTSSIYAEQLCAGQNYVELRPAIGICVLEQSMFPHLPQMHLDFRLREQSGAVLTDDLQIHLVELSKSQATKHNLGSVTPLERWAWFLLNAHRLDVETLRKLLPEPEFYEAVGVLEMISRNPEQKRLYDSRLKFQRDEAARLQFARMEGEQIGQVRGEQIGQVRGEQIGQVRLLQQLLGLPQTTADELSKLNSTDLAAKVEVLQRQLRERGVI